MKQVALIYLSHYLPLEMALPLTKGVEPVVEAWKWLGVVV